MCWGTEEAAVLPRHTAPVGLENLAPVTAGQVVCVRPVELGPQKILLLFCGAGSAPEVPFDPSEVTRSLRGTRERKVRKCATLSLQPASSLPGGHRLVGAPLGRFSISGSACEPLFLGPK